MTSGANDVVPSGIVAFLFSDVEGSTALWAADEAAMSTSLQVHDRLVRDEIERRGGYVFTTAGDAFCAAFQRASDAVTAAQRIQEALSNAVWPGPSLSVRIGVHLGEAEERGGDYFGPTVNTTARVESAGHGGQILITDPVRTAANVAGTVDLGAQELKDVPNLVRIFQVGDGEFPPLRSVTRVSSNIPTTPTRLLGREDDVRRIRLLLVDHRLVTLMAVGGTGKTRVAIEVADQELPHWRDGVWFVDLTQSSSDSDVAMALAQIIGLEIQSGDVASQVVRFLANRSMLIVLDNCEHLIDACADLVKAVLAGGTMSKVLATSREWLDIDFEQVFQLPSLNTTDPDGSAVRLFVQRAQSFDPDFVADVDGVVAEVCRRLDGMPLAIELAAARVAVLSPSDLLKGLDDRFRLLSGGRRRQRGRTLESTIGWSYDLLDDDEQRFFRCLGVFLGSFDIAAAATVADVPAAEAADLVEALFARSLIARSSKWAGRFQLLETVKAYAEDRLVDAEEALDTRERLHQHFAPASTPTLVVPTMSLSRLSSAEADQPNLAQVADWLEANARWKELAEHLLNPVVISSTPLQNLAALARCRPHINDSGLDSELAQAQIVCAMQTSDWKTFAGTCMEETAKLDPHYAGWAHLSLALATAVADPEQALIHVDRFAELPSRLEPDIKRRSELSMRSAVYALSGATALARDHAEAAVNIPHGSDGGHFDYVSVQQVIGVCAWADSYRSGVTTSIDRIQMLVGTTSAPMLQVFGGFLIALRATIGPSVDHEPVKDFVRRFAGGQLAQGESDAIVVLAALSEAEGDAEYARVLLMSTINPRTPAAHLAVHLLATRLGVAEEVRTLRMAGTADGSFRNLNFAKQTLRAELERRNWLD